MIINHTCFVLEVGKIQPNSQHTDFISHNEPCAMNLGIFLQAFLLFLCTCCTIGQVFSVGSCSSHLIPPNPIRTDKAEDTVYNFFSLMRFCKDC